MQSFLEKILLQCRQRLGVTKVRAPLSQVREAAEARLELGSDVRDFEAVLAVEGLGVIAELKRASPSRGVLSRDYRPGEIAPSYEAGGAVALSVLTEEEFFRGSLDHLRQAREAVSLPVLRKDFVFDPYQVFESVAAGADALLLIVAALGDDELRELIDLSSRLRIAALVEVHHEEEARRAVAAGARIIGVNNRDLRTFEVTLETSLRLRPVIPAGCLAVSESGISSATDLARLCEAGFDAVLIGERLIAQPDPGRALAELLEARSQETGARRLSQ
ncbi:MAG TPA: indole-3-glycerol phosphate synthase TrpC [Terriglobia bacterium]|nr:indole-3-glycerol phosphate synthase TrpC [Terriglobia bacterium]